MYTLCLIRKIRLAKSKEGRAIQPKFRFDKILPYFFENIKDIYIISLISNELLILENLIFIFHRKILELQLFKLLTSEHQIES